MPGCLYVVATPIGNLGDVTRRAVNVLGTVETIASEDTRRTSALLAHLNIRRPRLVSLRDDNEPRAAQRVFERLEAGEQVALVSDAGTPLVSDPGYRLVSLCRERGIPVSPVPGASAVTAALSVCPLPLGGYRFEGFLDAGPAARERELEAICESGQATLFFEAPHRMASTLGIIARLAPDRVLMVAREMTKKFESFHTGTADAILSELELQDSLRGEFVCVLEGVARQSGRELDERRLLKALARELPPARAARIMAEVCGGAKSDYYDRVLAAAEPTPDGDATA